ncbi:MAG: chemotaxis protein CheW [Terriglobales bacterium]
MGQLSCGWRGVWTRHPARAGDHPLPGTYPCPELARFHGRGVINLRGRVIPVVSLRKRFGLEEQPHDKQSRIVVVELKGNVLGFIVDSVSEVLRIPAETVKPPPRLGKVEREYVSGVGNLHDRLLILLDLEHLMSHSDETWMQASVN